MGMEVSNRLVRRKKRLRALEALGDLFFGDRAFADYSPVRLGDIDGGVAEADARAAIENQVDAAIHAQAGIAGPVIVLAVGTQRYRALKDRVAKQVLERLPSTLLEAQDYTTSVIDLEATIVDKMNQLTNEEYESILRPVFKDDEPLMIAVGAVLGGIVGEIQVQLIELLGR